MKRALFLFVGFLVLYGLTAQRGLGWGDSGEFQYRVLFCENGLLAGCDSFATSHPLYMVLAKALCATPFHVTLLSAFFGALAVTGFCLCSRNFGLSVVFGLAHGVWWLSCVAEVYTMSLSFVAFETLLLFRFLETRRFGWLAGLLFLNGLHLELHNMALLALPVYAVVAADDLRRWPFRGVVLRGVVLALVWTIGASFWLHSLVVRGMGDVLVGSYVGQAFGVLPSNWTIALFNWALVGMSVFVPLSILWWNRHAFLVQGPQKVVLVLLVVHFLFFVRYFIVSQFTFSLPTVFFAYLLASRYPLSSARVKALVALQILIPLIAGHVLVQLPRPAGYARHKYRNDAQYFAWPWKFNDRSADRYAAELGGVWNGYPDCEEGGVK